MQIKKFTRHPLIAGTFFLTFAALLSRLIGFFYRIFLSHTIGAEGVGIYQLIFPIYALAYSIAIAGIQTAISKFVAEAAVYKNSRTQERSSHSFTYLYTGLAMSLLLAFLCTFLLYQYADFFAVHFLEEARCAKLLRILALTIPFCSVHSCINGYFYGLKKTVIPAVSQLIEQLIRVGAVYVIFSVRTEQGQAIGADIAVWGIVLGEIASTLYCISFTKFGNGGGKRLLCARNILTLSLPLTANRVLLNLLNSMEAVMIPGKLKDFGYNTSEALSVFGVLTGMALPMILFPSAITNSVSVVLLPAISEADAKGDRNYIKNAVKKTCFYCIVLGLCCTLIFLISGKWIGRIIFANELAGTLIVALGWICPFLYLTTTLSSILNGLGRTTTTFIMNMIGSSLRVLFVAVMIPFWGIKAYLWGTLVSHLVMALWAVLVLYILVFGRKK